MPEVEIETKVQQKRIELNKTLESEDASKTKQKQQESGHERLLAKQQEMEKLDKALGISERRYRREGDYKFGEAFDIQAQE